MSQVVTNDRDEIRRLVSAAINKAAGVIANVKTARDEFLTEADNAIGERESLLTTLAAASHQGKWSGDDVAEIVAEAIKQRTNGQKNTTLATFGAEIKRMCSRNVRGQVAQMFATAREAFVNEAQAVAEAKAAGDSKPATPLRKAFGRMYHAVVQFGAKAVDDGKTLATTGDWQQFAIDTLRARAIDYRKVKARLDAIRKDLLSFADDFPVDGLTSAAEFLESITTDELRACVEHTSDDADDEPEADTSAPGASDELADVLADMSGTNLKAA